PIIITGDFNAPPESEVIQQVLADGTLSDVRSLAPTPLEANGTYHEFGKIPPEKQPIIDYIFVTNHFAGAACTPMPEKWENIFLSDHTPVYGEVTIAN
ncbi:MAG: endonuclease, partial [Prevotellaceae bacterium]|nr:endonuclease [Prevotellaceae bacterium]